MIFEYYEEIGFCLLEMVQKWNRNIVAKNRNRYNRSQKRKTATDRNGMVNTRKVTVANIGIMTEMIQHQTME